jgi:hypothetical protein
MKKILNLLVVFVLSMVFIAPKAQAELPPKMKAFLTVSAYGAGAGALLGTASMAFGNTGRAVAQGASLGLYAGILFGTYVLVSHHQKRYGDYEDSGTYQESKDIYGDGYDSEDGGSSGGESSEESIFNRIQTMQMKFGSQNNKGGNLPPLYLNLLNYNF